MVAVACAALGTVFLVQTQAHAIGTPGSHSSSYCVSHPTKC
jgi:hypothetical protein